MQLILCDVEQDLNRIRKKWKHIISDDIIIATKNIFLYNSLKQTETVYLLQESFDSKYEESVKILKKLNQIIDEATKFPYLYEADYSIEGNGCGQWITDALYAAELCSEFIKQHSIDEVFVCCVDCLALETRVLYSMEWDGKLKLHICYHKVSSKFELVQFIHCNIGKEWMMLKHCYYLLRGIWIFTKAFIKSIRDMFAGNMGKKQQKVLYSRGSIFITNAKKHLDRSIDYYRELNKYQDYAIICVSAPEAEKFFKGHGFNVVSFESSGIRMSKLIASVFGYYKSIFRLYSVCSKLDYSAYDINFEHIIQLFFMWHLLLYVPERVVRDCIAEVFFSRYRFKMIETWLGSNDAYGRIFYQYTRADKTIFWRRIGDGSSFAKPTLFEEVYPDMLEYVYFIGKYKKEYEVFYRSFGWKGKAVLLDDSKCIIGNKLIYDKFINEFESRSISVLWAPSYPSAGYMRENSFVDMNLGMVCSLPSERVRLYVKYHLNCAKTLIADTMNSARNVYFFDNKERITDALAMADIVVTTISTVIVDSIYNNKPCIILLAGQNTEILNEKIKAEFLTFYSVGEVKNYIENATREDLYELYVRECECMEELSQSDVDDVNYEIAQSLVSICKKI